MLLVDHIGRDTWEYDEEMPLDILLTIQIPSDIVKSFYSYRTIPSFVSEKNMGNERKFASYTSKNTLMLFNCMMTYGYKASSESFPKQKVWSHCFEGSIFILCLGKPSYLRKLSNHQMLYSWCTVHWSFESAFKVILRLFCCVSKFTNNHLRFNHCHLAFVDSKNKSLVI